MAYTKLPGTIVLTQCIIHIQCTCNYYYKTTNVSVLLILAILVI